MAILIKFNFNNEENKMSKKYALLDIDHALLIEKIEDNGERTKVLNENIVNALIENHITDVYLFTDTVIHPANIEDHKWIIEQLQMRGLTIWGALTTADLFWTANHEELDKFGYYMVSNFSEIVINYFNSNNFLALSQDELNRLVEKFITIGSALRDKVSIAPNMLGKAFFDVETTAITLQDPFARNRLRSAVIAARLLSTLSPGKPQPKALLYQHFVRHKPSDCTSCVIFEDKAEVIQSTLAISQNDDLKRIAIKVERGDFDDLGSRRRYNHEIQNFLIQENPDRVQLQVPSQTDNLSANRESIAENSSRTNNNVVRQEWPNITSLAFKKLDETYYKQRGFRFFGSSDESITLLNKINSYAITANAKHALIKNYLIDENNKGKRLYTLLIELRHVHKEIQMRNQQNEVWLTPDMLYLIEEEYKNRRGFIFFGSTCSESAKLRDILKDDETGLIEKQIDIDNYIRKPEHIGKRMYDVLLKILNQPVAVPELAPPRP